MRSLRLFAGDIHEAWGATYGRYNWRYRRRGYIERLSAMRRIVVMRRLRRNDPEKFHEVVVQRWANSMSASASS